jgi:hypothetical protein
MDSCPLYLSKGGNSSSVRDAAMMLEQVKKFFQWLSEGAVGERMREMNDRKALDYRGFTRSYCISTEIVIHVEYWKFRKLGMIISEFETPAFNPLTEDMTQL